MKRYILPFVAGASLLFAVSWTFAERPVREPSNPPAPPPETTSAHTVAAVGLVEPGTENIALSCAVSGLVTSLYVKAGDRVRSERSSLPLTIATWQRTWPPSAPRSMARRRSWRSWRRSRAPRSYRPPKLR